MSRTLLQGPRPNREAHRLLEQLWLRALHEEVIAEEFKSYLIELGKLQDILEDLSIETALKEKDPMDFLCFHCREPMGGDPGIIHEACAKAFMKEASSASLTKKGAIAVRNFGGNNIIWEKGAFRVITAIFESGGCRTRMIQEPRSIHALVGLLDRYTSYGANVKVDAIRDIPGLGIAVAYYGDHK